MIISVISSGSSSSSSDEDLVFSRTPKGKKTRVQQPSGSSSSSSVTSSMAFPPVRAVPKSTNQQPDSSEDEQEEARESLFHIYFLSDKVYSHKRVTLVDSVVSDAVNGVHSDGLDGIVSALISAASQHQTLETRLSSVENCLYLPLNQGPTPRPVSKVCRGSSPLGRTCLSTP